MGSKKKSLLWEINHPESIRTSYLFGTMHVKDNKAFSKVDLVLKCMKECNLLACEYNLEEARGKGLGEVLMLPDQKRLIDLVGERKYARWKKICAKAFSLDLDQVQRLLPMTIISVLSERLMQKDNAVSLDQFLWEQGTEMGLKLDGVERFEDQKMIMGEIEVSDQLKMLKDLFKNVNSFKKQINKLLKLYQQEEIHELFKRSKKSLGKYKHLLLHQRNEKMADSIFLLTEDHNAFIAIGAAHLSGKVGVLHLLKKKGLKLKPLSS